MYVKQRQLYNRLEIRSFDYHDLIVRVRLATGRISSTMKPRESPEDFEDPPSPRSSPGCASSYIIVLVSFDHSEQRAGKYHSEKLQ